MRKQLLLFLTLWLSLNSLSYAQTEICEQNGVIIGPYLTTFLNNPEFMDEVTVVVTFEDADVATQARPQIKELGGEFVGPTFEIIPMQGVNVSLDEMIAMTEIPGVKGIWHNRKMNQEMHQAVITSSVVDVWDDMDFEDLNGGLPVTGRGVGVLVNDSGFDGDDTDLQATPETLDGEELDPRIVKLVRGNGSELNYNWIESEEGDTDQGGGHGSHCMGIVGGDGRHSDGKIVGVAPGAHLLGYGSGAGLFILDTGGGFEYIAKHHKDYNIRAMSNSFGTTSDTTFMEFNSHVNAPLNVATKTLTDAGVIVVFSAGNSGPTDGKITGVYKTAPWVITVANGEKGGSLAGSSSRGRKDSDANGTVEDTDDGVVHPSQREEITVDGVNYLWENRPTVTAPGTDIVSVRATGSAIAPLAALDDVNLELEELPYYTILTGTSMACPHVAGIVALMVEANPQLEWRAAKAVLQRTAIDAMSEAFYQRGAGYVNAHAAVAASFHGLCDVDENATYEEKYGLNTDGSFGFDEDTWKNCTLHPEVEARLKASIPVPGEVEQPCADGVAPLTDPTGANDEPASTMAHFDIKEVKMDNETETEFDIVMELAGDLALSPGGIPAPGNQYYYDAHFTLSKPTSDDNTERPTPDIIYIVSSYNDLTEGIQFRLTVRTADGTTRPNTQAFHYDVITGGWDTDANTITWTVPKANLNVSSTSQDNSSTEPTGVGLRNSRGAKAGDKLSNFEAYIYQRVGSVTPDGPGVYNDSALGTCFKLLEVAPAQ